MIRQLSVFVENQPGSMMRVTSVLTDSHINIRAISTFDTPEFGIMRLVGGYDPAGAGVDEHSG
mgnify:CR=1 FL=1